MQEPTVEYTGKSGGVMAKLMPYQEGRAERVEEREQGQEQDDQAGAGVQWLEIQANYYR
jgi:hypothetical protein